MQQPSRENTNLQQPTVQIAPLDSPLHSSEASDASDSDEEELTALAALIPRQRQPQTRQPSKEATPVPTQRFVKAVVPRAPAASGAGGDAQYSTQDSSAAYEDIFTAERPASAESTTCSGDMKPQEQQCEDWPFAYREGAMTPPPRLFAGEANQESPPTAHFKTEPARPSSAAGDAPMSALDDLLRLKKEASAPEAQSPPPASDVTKQAPVPHMPLAWGAAKTHTSFVGASHAYGIQPTHIPGGNTAQRHAGPMWLPYMQGPMPHMPQMGYHPAYRYPSTTSMVQSVPAHMAHSSAAGPSSQVQSTHTATTGASRDDQPSANNSKDNSNAMKVEASSDVVALWHMQQAQFHAAQAKMYRQQGSSAGNTQHPTDGTASAGST